MSYTKSYKSIISDVISIIGLFAVIIMAIFVIKGYFSNHEYYTKMLEGKINNNMILFYSGIIYAFIPIIGLFFLKKLKYFILLLYTGLVLFGFTYISNKSGGLFGSGFFMWILNSALIFGFMLIFLSSLLTTGRYLKIKLLGFKETNLFGLITGFGLGLVSFLFLLYLLLLFNLFYPVISWIIFFGMILSIVFLKDYFLDSIKIIDNFFSRLIEDLTFNKYIIPFFVILLTISILYFYFGFMMAYIPYPTAWDANHAYMFYPKMRALHNGFYWNEISMNSTPYIWLTYITFWFSLFVPFYKSFWISPDTWAVEMNFLSGIFVLILSLATIGNFVFDKKNNKYAIAKYILFFSAWMVILAWLTSGMGAFLVFVDNKTDLGVLTLITLALYSGFLLFKYIYDKKFNIVLKFKRFDENIYEGDISVKLAILSGLFFAVAVSSKPTAFFDVVNFTAFLTFGLISHSLAVAIFLLVIAYLALSKFRGITDYLTPYAGKVIGIIGIIFSFLGIGEIIYKFNKNINKFYNLFGIIFIWGLSFLFFLAVIKGLWIGLESIYYDRYHTITDIVKAILFG